MNILVVGCGKVGSQLAAILDQKGHDISIVDNLEESFNLLPDDFKGFTTVGAPIDQDVLKRAGIESCDAFAAVTQDDNINIMASELARQIFKVPKVFTRIYDPRREDVFTHFGLSTVCPTNLTVDAVCSALFDEEQPRKLQLGARVINFCYMDAPKQYFDVSVDKIEFEENEVLYAIERNNVLMLVGLNNIKIEKGDKLIFSRIID